MNLDTSVKKLSQHPVPHQVMMDILRDYKRPNDKIHSLIQEQKLIVLKRGLYVWNSDVLPENFSIANSLYAPSYISVESALAYYGLIPERVFSIVSMTIRSSKKFKNSLGDFEFLKLPTPYYSFGIKQIELRENQFALIATPEKALMDKVVSTSGLLIRSEKAAWEFILENLRMDAEQLKSFKTEEMRSWLETAPKQHSLHYLIKSIESL